MKKKRYINCTVKDDGKEVIVELNANDKELIAMLCAIVYNVSATLGIDLEKLCSTISKLTVEAVKARIKEEEKEDEDH